MRLLILFFVPLSLSKFIRDPQEVPSKYHLKYLINLLNLYKHFSFVIHSENETLHAANFLLQNINQNVPFSCFNYDESSGEIKRYRSIKIINIVLMVHMQKFGRYILNYQNVNIFDVIIFVQIERDLELDDMKLVHLAGNILVLDASHSGRATLYNKCSFCGSGFKKLNLLQLTNGTNVILQNRDILPRQFKQLHGETLLVSYIEYFPYFYCKKIVYRKIMNNFYNSCVEFRGSEVQLLKVVADAMNFTFHFIHIAGNGSVRLQLENLVKRNVDLVIGGVSVTYNRFKIVTYTKHLRLEDFTLLYVSRISILDTLKVFVQPFQNMTWLAFLASAIFISYCMHIFSIPGMKRKSFAKSLLICFRAVLEQSNPTLTSIRAFESRAATFLIFLVLYFTTMEMDTFYKTKLPSIFIRPPHKEPKSIEEIIKDGYDITINSRNLNFYTEMFNVEDPVKNFIQSHAVVLNGACTQLKYLTKNHAAMMNEYGMLQFTLQYQCFKEMYPKINTPEYNRDMLRIINQPVRSTPHAWALQPGIPIWKGFDNIIGKINSGGFMEKWNRDELAKVGHAKLVPFSKDNTREQNHPNLNTYSSCFIIYIFGNLLAFLVFIVEMIVKSKMYTSHFQPSSFLN